MNGTLCDCVGLIRLVAILEVHVYCVSENCLREPDVICVSVGDFFLRFSFDFMPVLVGFPRFSRVKIGSIKRTIK
jgi:hypothetical protein